MTDERKDLLTDEVVAWIRAYGKKKYPHSTWYPTAPAEELLTKWSPPETGRVLVEFLTAARQSDEAGIVAAKREGWKAGLVEGYHAGHSAGRCGVPRADGEPNRVLTYCGRTLDEAAAHRYPLPPRECVLSDGSVVRMNHRDGAFKFTRSYPHGGSTVSRSSDNWRDLADTGADFDKLKSFAAGVGR